MTELIKIQERGREQFVNGRELHRFLEVLTPYKKWFDRMCDYGFIENKDFIAYVQKSTLANNREYTKTDYLMKISMAKEISMLQRNEKDKEIHFYFIKCK
ncbi:MAG: antA/AntB antirepressor family protein [Fusobacterium sp.]|uniref:antA/AntB antirepressor family protein n=1 Tax=Fusobacterium sp. TaxID=68766 RepID=UPI002A76558C|nr:antA/AntB antirepressor family protein [Fusobacterium sp.]MDY2981376.1 antA/AntB antirepressor family protein [Fusobacterium sp.]